MSGAAQCSHPDAAAAVQKYYRWHAPIYDLTRWTFLFGRSELLSLISTQAPPDQALEVGCGTGRNLAELATCFPQARFTGVDFSEDMLARAAVRVSACAPQVRLLRLSYDAPLHSAPVFDLVLFSYSLSMMNPGWNIALKAAARDLKPGGRVAVVDFASTPLNWFRRWMWRNHVKLDHHLISALKQLFPDGVVEERSAYFGMWKYFLFLGTKTPGSAPDIYCQDRGIAYSGVCPSSGAASPDAPSASSFSRPPLHLDVAAPEDGRTPAW